MDPSLSFNPYCCDYLPSKELVAQSDRYFKDDLTSHLAWPSLGPIPDSLAPSMEEPVSVKRLRGVLQRGAGFLVRISVPNSENKAIVHLLPQVYSTGMEAALAYDYITRLLLLYRARPFPLNFVTSFANPQDVASMNTYF
jgi:hypothetical protein